eukprot:5227906-Amphidinium_carterae.1
MIASSVVPGRQGYSSVRLTNTSTGNPTCLAQCGIVCPAMLALVWCALSMTSRTFSLRCWAL